jgi:uncharacterized protein (TIGR02099 family)
LISLAKWLRRLRSLLWTAFSMLVIFAAILVGLGKLLMPYSDRYQPQLESWLSKEFGYPVNVESFAGQWRAFGPRLTLKGLRIQSQESSTAADEMLISEAALELKPLSLLIPGEAFYSFLVIGADLQLVRDAQGALHLSGLGLTGRSKTGSASVAEPSSRFRLDRLVGVGELQLENSSLDLIDEKLSKQLHFSAINAHLQMRDDQLAISVESSLVDLSSGRDYGLVEGVAKVSFMPAGGLQTAAWHGSISDLLLVHLQEQLPDHGLIPRRGELDAEVWGQWSDAGELTQDGSFEIRNSWLSNGSVDLFLDQLASRFSLRGRSSESWQLDLSTINLNQGEMHLQLPGLTVARDLEKNVGLWLGADYLPLQEIIPLGKDLAALLNQSWPAMLPAHVSGSVTDFDVVLAADWSSRWLSGEFRNVDVSEWPRMPALSGISGHINLRDEQGVLSLNAPALRVDWPAMFSEQLQLSLPECGAELLLGPQWQVDLRGCHVFNDDISARGDVRIVASENRPAVDINAEVLRLDIAKLSPYWPIGVMPDSVTRWLRNNLRAGQVSSGRVLIHGDMDNWPFSNGAGRFEARASVENGELSFASGWPVLQQVTATASFIAAGMEVQGQAESFGGVPVQQASARIASFGNALLQVDFHGSDKISEVLELLQKTPLLPPDQVDLDAFNFGGNVQAGGRLELPLGKRPGKLQLKGEAQVSRASFLHLASGVKVDSVEGDLSFDQRHVQAQNMTASYKDQPARLDLLVGGDPQWALQAALKGQFDVASVLPDFLLSRQDVVARLAGRAEWLAELKAPVKRAISGQPVLLRVSSGLQGVELDFPAPLAKADFEIWPFTLQYPLTGSSRLLQIELNEEVFVAAEVLAGASTASEPPTVQRAVISLGEANAANLPVSRGLQLAGRVNQLDLDGWVDLLAEAAGRNDGMVGLKLEQFTVEADRLVFLDRWFDQVQLGVKLNGSDIRAEFDAKDIAGHLLFTTSTDGRKSLNAEFERLALGKPIADGMDTDSNPADLPELHLYAQSFRYAGLELGETRIEAYPDSDGFHFESIESQSDSLSVRASGNWLLQEQGPRSAFDIMMTAESLGELLSSLGISSSLQGGQTVLNFHAWWPGSPAAFALARLNGEIDFSVTRGQITNATSGTGKLLGLLSIQSLPRRLSLDFRDVFDSGFGFETATGTFQMENGTATTSDVELTSSAARIRLSGSTDLVKQQYNQQMTVMPGVGNTLPVIGALAAGPGGAAAGLALQGLLHKQLGKATQVQYTIKGSWDEPVIEPVVKLAETAANQQEQGTPDE